MYEDEDSPGCALPVFMLFVAGMIFWFMFGYPTPPWDMFNG